MGDLAGKGHVMTAIEILDRAISKLEQLRDEAEGPLPWHDEAHEGSSYTTRVIGADGHPVPGCFNCGDNEGIYEGTDADLIVALSRTVAPMLALLREALGSIRWTQTRGALSPTEGIAIRLARAILGEETDHAR